MEEGLSGRSDLGEEEEMTSNKSLKFKVYRDLENFKY